MAKIEDEIDALVGPDLDFPPGPVVPSRVGGYPFGGRIENAEQGYLPFPAAPKGSGAWTIQAQPQVLFKGVALMLWGFDDTSVITNIYIGQQVQGAASFGELPASFFGTAKSYEKLIEDFEKNGISPPNWITWRACQVGNLVSITGRGPLSHAVMLGKLSYFRAG